MVGDIYKLLYIYQAFVFLWEYQPFLCRLLFFLRLFLSRLRLLISA